MDASALRWTLAIIGIVLLVGIYLHGLYQNRQRKRIAMETLTSDAADSVFIEDEELHAELDNLSQIMGESDDDYSFDEIKINTAIETDSNPAKPSSPEWFVADIISSLDPDQMVGYLLYHSDYQFLVNEKVENAMRLIGLIPNMDGYMEYHHEYELIFTVVSLSAPGHFFDIDEPEFFTQGLHCFIDLQTNCNPPAAYEIMLKKIDELVHLLDIKVYQSNHDLLAISDVTRVRSKLSS
jgi:FtsZ-interacting cell division protein ZipA